MFSEVNYPKSYASIKQNDFRLKEFIIDNIPEEVFYKFEQFCLEQTRRKKPLDVFNNYQYIASGWEWSVFRKDDTKVIKIPAQIFNEVNEAEYLENLKELYRIFKQHYSEEFLPNTVFKNVNGLNFIEQDYLEGSHDTWLYFGDIEVPLKNKLKQLLNQTKQLIKTHNWVPDFDLYSDQEKFIIKNIAINEKEASLKILDYSNYLDPTRMYPEMTKQYIKRGLDRINKILANI